MPHVPQSHLDDEAEPAGPAPDVHVAEPLQSTDTRSRRSTWFLKIGLETLLISMGVFLALMGEQWRENAHTRELAEGSLQRFRAEILTNRAAVVAVRTTTSLS